MTVDSTADKLYSDLVAHTRAVVDRHGEAHITCPACGHESTPRDPHCSFSERGWHCFSCGEGSSLRDLARRVNLEAGDYMPSAAPRKAPEKRRTGLPYWMTLNSPEACQSRYESHPRRFELWAGYKRLSYELIEACGLGVGALPPYSSKCSHERLIVPVWWGTIFVGFRARSLGCDCGKWLATAGWDYERAPLYNQDALRSGAVVWIVENPIDALIVGEQTPYIGVATYSVSYWRDAWTAALREARPELIVVAYDQDLPGNGGAQRRREFERVWLADPKHKAVPRPNGIRLVNDLLRAGLPATLFDWGRAENKMDIGSLLGAAV
jgi:predicted RNA-binding Zn-ribbon protein involved in translation (DUF1610 family)